MSDGIRERAEAVYRSMTSTGCPCKPPGCRICTDNHDTLEQALRDERKRALREAEEAAANYCCQDCSVESIRALIEEDDR